MRIKMAAVIIAGLMIGSAWVKASADCVVMIDGARFCTEGPHNESNTDS